VLSGTLSHCDLWLDMVLLLVEIKCLHGSGEVLQQRCVQVQNYYFYCLLRRTYYISHIFLLGSLIMIVREMDMTLTHFEIAFKFGSTLFR
jgi:hypothetical protein